MNPIKFEIKLHHRLNLNGAKNTEMIVVPENETAALNVLTINQLNPRYYVP